MMRLLLFLSLYLCLFFCSSLCVASWFGSWCTDDDTRWLFVCCSLSGEGIPTEKVEALVRIFDGTSEDFKGEKNDCEVLPGRIEGGLSIASEIVRKMGGAITVSSALGQGTEFNVSYTLPHVLNPVFIV